MTKKCPASATGLAVWQQEREQELMRDISCPQSMGMPVLFAGALWAWPWSGQTPEAQQEAEE